MSCNAPAACAVCSICPPQDLVPVSVGTGWCASTCRMLFCVAKSIGAGRWSGNDAAGWHEWQAQARLSPGGRFYSNGVRLLFTDDFE